MTISAKVQVKKEAKKAQKELEALAKSLRDKKDQVVIGLPRNSNPYPDGTSVVEVGAIHEFGFGKVPQRSFLRVTLNKQRQKYKDLFTRLSKKMVKKELTKERALGLVGASFQGDVIERINSGISPELKLRDGTPLHDTGHLIQSITFEVRE